MTPRAKRIAGAGALVAALLIAVAAAPFAQRVRKEHAIGAYRGREYQRLSQIHAALESYHRTHGRYPQTVSEIVAYNSKLRFMIGETGDEYKYNPACAGVSFPVYCAVATSSPVVFTGPLARIPEQDRAYVEGYLRMVLLGVGHVSEYSAFATDQKLERAKGAGEAHTEHGP